MVWTHKWTGHSAGRAIFALVGLGGVIGLCDGWDTQPDRKQERHEVKRGEPCMVGLDWAGWAELH